MFVILLIWVQHQGMGDAMAKIVAKSIGDIPFIQSVNLADNSLTDAGA